MLNGVAAADWEDAAVEVAATPELVPATVVKVGSNERLSSDFDQVKLNWYKSPLLKRRSICASKP